MFDPKIIDDLSKKITDSMPTGFAALQGDLERNLKSSLEAGLAKLNLVTREEFDIQQAVLHRTREKLEALERQVAELEKQVG